MFHAKQIGKNKQFLEMESCLPGLHCYTSIFPLLRKHPLGPPRYIHLRGEVREVFVWCQCTLLCHSHDFAKAFLFVLWWEADGKEARKIWLYINVYNLWFYEYIYICICNRWIWLNMYNLWIYNMSIYVNNTHWIPSSGNGSVKKNSRNIKTSQTFEEGWISYHRAIGIHWEHWVSPWA